MSDASSAAESSSAEPSAADEPGALVSRLQVIEQQPLADRAAALGQLHDELRAALEAGDARPHG